MKKTLWLLALAVPTAQAFEYPLNFTPPAGNIRNVVVAGYAFSGSSVVGDCSYEYYQSGSGRDPGGKWVPVPQTCTWDPYGVLVSTQSGEPAAPTPLYTNGTQTVYATDGGNDYTGVDSAVSPNHGFVFTFGSHYYWVTPNTYQVLSSQKPITITLTLASDGDTALNVSSVKASALTAKIAVRSTTCTGSVPVGGTCTVTLKYNPFLLSSASGLAYDTITVHLTSDAGQANDFVQSFTITVRVVN